MLVALGFVALATDAPTLAIVLGFAGTVVTAILGAITAIALNKNEKRATAENTLEKALRERITLRDEEIADLREDNEQLKRDNDLLRAERDKAVEQRDRLYMAIAEQRAEERVRNEEA